MLLGITQIHFTLLSTNGTLFPRSNHFLEQNSKSAAGKFIIPNYTVLNRKFIIEKAHLTKS